MASEFSEPKLPMVRTGMASMAYLPQEVTFQLVLVPTLLVDYYLAP